MNLNNDFNENGTSIKGKNNNPHESISWCKYLYPQNEVVKFILSELIRSKQA
jgi:hypothetical protein